MECKYCSGTENKILTWKKRKETFDYCICIICVEKIRDDLRKAGWRCAEDKKNK